MNSKVINGKTIMDENKKSLDNTIRTGWAFNAFSKRFECVYCGALPTKYMNVPCACRER